MTKKDPPQVLLVQSWWEDRVLRGVARYAAEHDWILDCSMRWMRELPEPLWQGDGIIAYTGIANPAKRLIDYVRAAGVPVVETQTVTRLPGSGAVIIAEERIGELAAEHLLSLDFLDIGFVTFQENLIESGRRNGAQKRVAAAGGSFHLLRYKDLAKDLERVSRPLGLIAANDANALKVIQTCTQAGYGVPEEIAIVGVDDTEILCDLSAIPLTSVNCNFEQQGYEAAALLDAMMAGKPAPKKPIVIEPRGITVRRSTDTIAMPDAHSAKFLRYLRDHFRGAVSLGASAREIGVNMRRVQGHFRRHLGRSVVQELVRLRIEHAKKLLCNDPEVKVETVGNESGFRNRSHFVKMFTRSTGVTPKRFRDGVAPGR